MADRRTSHAIPPAPGEEAASLSADLAEIERLFAENYPYCRGKLRATIAAAPAMDCRDLLDTGLFEEAIAPFAAQYPGADRRAVVSMWTQYYAASLVIPAIVASLVTGRALPLDLDRLAVALDEGKHVPVGFLLTASRDREAGPGAFARFRSLVRGHLEPLFAAIAAHSGLSRRVLWGNAGSYLEWVLTEIAAHAGAEVAEPGYALVRHREWPDGWPNPLFETIRTEHSGSGPSRRRRVCCLRYLLPSVPGCGSLCPLPAGR